MCVCVRVWGVARSAEASEALETRGLLRVHRGGRRLRRRTRHVSCAARRATQSAGAQCAHVAHMMPMLNAEFGIATDGRSTPAKIDPNKSELVFAVTNWSVARGYTGGFVGWCWDAKG